MTFEDWSVDVDQVDDDESTGRPLGTGFDLLPIDHQLLGLLAAHDGPAGICPSLARMAEKLGVSRRYVRQRLAGLESAGLVERVAVFEVDDDPEWKRRGRRSSHPRRQTSNTYRLSRLPPPVPTPLGTEPDAQQARPPSSTPRNSPESAATPVPTSKGDYLQPVSERGLLKAPRAREPVEISVEPPEAAMLDHHPDVGEVLAALDRSFGEVLVLEGPATYRTARGRLLDLAAGSAEDFHAAVDQLDRDTCMDGGCQDDYRCRRHTRRMRTGHDLTRR